MPNVYAHASLGRQAVPQMSASHQKTIQAHPRAFALGLQGPDIFFYGSIFRDAEAGAFGSRLHRWSGRKVLESMLAPYAYQPLPAGVKAYLLGFLGHYRLDATTHPYVYAVQGDMVHHRALETDFDAFLLKREDHPAPWKSRLTKVLPATLPPRPSSSKLTPPGTTSPQRPFAPRSPIFAGFGACYGPRTGQPYG